MRRARNGLYLGNSDSSGPFIAGIIEDKLIVDTIGYNIEIKPQAEPPKLPDAPMTAEFDFLLPCPTSHSDLCR